MPNDEIPTTTNQTQVVGIQADHYDTLDSLRDTSLLLAYNLYKLGLEVFWYSPSDLVLADGDVYAYGEIVALDHDDDAISCKPVGSKIRYNLAEVFLILIRQDPPVDMAYITSTMLLEKVSKQTLILNNPTSLRNHCEKILPLTICPKNCPPTIISANLDAIQEFSIAQKEVVLKPLFACGGSGVLRINQALSREEIAEYLKNNNQNPIIVQKYLPEIINGDKRIFIFNGEVIGSIRRLPKAGEFLSNLCQGATALRINMTDNEVTIAKNVAKSLQRMDIIFAAIDIIGEYVIEVNTTSPTGLREYSRLYDLDIGAYIAQSMVELTHKFYGTDD